MKLVQASQMIQKDLKAFADRRKFKIPMNHNIKNWQEPETNVAEINR